MVILKKGILFLSDLTDLPDLLIVKTPTMMTHIITFKCIQVFPSVTFSQLLTIMKFKGSFILTAAKVNETK